jgi:polyvinyl alcohol dehydrogenase (cytochrome)
MRTEVVPVPARLAGLCLLGLLFGSGSAAIASPDGDAGVRSLPVPASSGDGVALYGAHCAACHDGGVYKAPGRAILTAMAPDSILRSLTDGSMRAQGAALAPGERRAIAEFLGGRAIDATAAVPLPPSCGPDEAFDASLPPVSLGWGVDAHNTRFQPEATGALTAAEAPSLDVRWVFAYPGAVQARSQPVYGGGLIYVGSQDGTVWALGAETGCLEWTFRADAEVRTGIAISSWDADAASAEPTIFFGDMRANVYALDARTGAPRWRLRADDHADATLTGTPAWHEGRLYVSVSSLEVVAAANPAYPCCSFAGAVLALDAASGDQLWKARTTDTAPAQVGETDAGTAILAPSGAPVWSAPTVDGARGRLYVGTGQSYSSPADGNSDALIAYDLATGEKLWASQQTSADAWNVACFIGIPGIDPSNCPSENGPDHDFGSSPILVSLGDGEDVLVAGQKSGEVVGVDPDTGETLWKTAVGRGGVQGGVHFGMAAEGSTVYVPINDLVLANDDLRYDSGRPSAPGVHALDARTGALLWSAPNEDLCGDLPFCQPGVSHAISAIPGAVVAGYLDGRLRIRAREDGALLYERNLLGPHDSVSGEVATGGAFSGGGVLIAHGLIYANAGYGYNNHIPGNALVVLGVPEAP